MSGMLRLKALGDLVRRYAAAFRHAWRHRVQMEGPARQPHEVAFLPAALALQETPVSPAPRVAMWMLMLFSAIALAWAVFGEIDVVATAQGRVMPNDRTKTIQPLETATVRAIWVSDGQLVGAGDVLVELDATTARADRERLRSDLAAARLQVARSKAMLAAMEHGRLPALPAVVEASESLNAEARRQLLGQYDEYRARARRVEAEIARREAEITSTREQVSKLEQTVPIARRRAEDFRNLVDRNFVSRHGYLEQEQSRIEHEADLAAQKSRLKEIEAAVREAREQRAMLDAETRRANLDDVTEGLQRGAALEQELLKAENRDRLMQLKSPVEGTVQQLAVHTVGGVVTEAQPLMMIVPRDKALEVEAFVDNKDIGFVRPGQPAEVKIETFQYTKYGTIHARIASVSHDAINDEKRGLIYSARVRMERSTIDVDGTPVNLGPGMAVSVEIKTGRRRVIEYFLSPLMQYGNESLRER
ncbi:HlyD family type I secretion periplasmic adaptor subunit [Thauera sinica]|uniref:Membrane fusion protein (MFP) family protein n=1 Tax=Thauera sinica TaxID=2665146 RepID=A0ABW1AWE9_9RHOO|nr:HlyD family type I secretion periplasmic adaptor subunit [Thauera sp. K11]ATE59902.1 hemolysin secretion protein D [Thauera sp. K11]